MNEAIVRSSRDIGASSRIGLSKRKQRVLGLVNMTRAAQGWSVLDPADAAHFLDVWMDQLDKAGVSPELYQVVFDMAVQRRQECVRYSQQPPAFTIELLLAMFHDYRDQVLSKVKDLKDALRRLEDMEVDVKKGRTEVKRAVEYIERRHDCPVVRDFGKYAVHKRLQLEQKIRQILEDSHLNGTAH